MGRQLNVPERNRFFTGREDVLTKLSELIKSNKEVAINQAIAGLGGMGKTQTAIEFCYKHINDYQTILWVRSENEADFNNSYLELANLLKLVEVGNPQALKIDQIVTLQRNKKQASITGKH
ncbi:MAG: ATP/GTP binding protein [bacterium]|nr:MAG: ATP/GTP binding protein [bacterium]